MGHGVKRPALGGEAGIRTLGTDEQYNGFRDRRIRPLCHLTGSKNEKL